jgi:hypothetical protein
MKLSQEEKEALQAQCAALGVTPSSYARALLRGQIGKGLPVAEPDRPLFEGLSEDMRRVGVNLNQGVRAMNEGRVGYEPQLIQALQQVIAQLLKVRKEVAALMEAPLRASIGSKGEL